MRVFIVAGEPSGDLHAARLMQQLRQQHPGVEFAGIGGAKMLEQGLTSIVPVEQMSVVGFIEVARNYFFFKQVLQRAERLMREWKADLFIAIDYPGFNTRMAACARRAHIPVMWYIAPQLWAWGRHRAKNFAKIVDELLVVFPFEVEYFKRFGIHAHFVGHPLLDDDAFGTAVAPLEGREFRVAFLPGSRVQEIHRHMPMFCLIAQQLHDELPLVRCSIATSASISPDVYRSYTGDASLFEFNDNARALMRRSSAGIVKTGTSTLEAALCGMPFSMMYKTSALSYAIGKTLIDLPYISLVNILSSKQVVREFVQKEATVHSIVSETKRLLMDHSYAETMHADFVSLRAQLGNRGASARAAECILHFLGSVNRKSSI